MSRLFRDLTPEEEVEFRQWAKDNFKPETDIISLAWHPIVRDECYKMIKEWEELNTIKPDIYIEFRGIDNYGRPVFKDINSRNHYGSVDILFPNNPNFDKKATGKDICEFFKNHPDKLEYFGTHFNCEPEGGKSKGNLIIKDF